MATTLNIFKAQNAQLITAVNTYHFDASDAAATDPNSVWFSDADAFDGNTATSAAVTHPNNGSTSSNYLMAEGTNSPTSGEPIGIVRARAKIGGDDLGGTGNVAIYTDGLGALLGTPTRPGTTSNAYSSYVTLTRPTGGWSWTGVSALEAKAYASGMTNINDSIYIWYIEIDVFAPLAPTIDYRNTHPVLDFDDSNSETAYFTGILPRSYDGGDLNVYVHFAATSATSGTGGWAIAFERIGNGSQDIDSGGFANEKTVTAATVPGTSGNVLISSVTVTNSEADGIQAGETYRLRIRRDVDNDSATGDLELLAVEVAEA